MLPKTFLGIDGVTKLWAVYFMMLFLWLANGIEQGEVAELEGSKCGPVHASYEHMPRGTE
jgi:hypothetical protein